MASAAMAQIFFAPLANVRGTSITKVKKSLFYFVIHILILTFDPVIIIIRNKRYNNMRRQILLIFLLLINVVNAGKSIADDFENGNHFKISVPAAGMLKTRLEKAVLDNSDYDVVDSLTVKGKFGGEDLAYLVKSEGILSELSYLDLSQVELVYDDKEYLSTSSSSDFYWATINHYLFSSENRDESKNYLSGGKTVTENTHYRNDFAYVFNGNKKLIDCRLPKSLKGIGENIFNGCEVLEKVTLPDNPTYVGNNAFKQVALKEIELPISVETIGDYAFERMPIETIDLSHVRSFGKGCLKGTSIKNIQLADGMESIPEEMFSSCWELTSVVIPSSVKSIGNNAFEECNNLETVSIPGSVESIGDKVFLSCDNLKTVNIAEGVKKIGSELFQECWAFENFSLSSTISLPSTIEEVGHHIFPEDWLRNTTTPLPFENGIWYIGKVAYALEMEPWTSDVKNGLTSLEFKEGTISIADDFTSNATGRYSIVYGLDQIKTISLPPTLRRIGRYSLSGSSVNSITLPDALEYIGDGAFRDSKKLRRITIPENVKYIGTGAFSGCGIMRVYYNAIEADEYKWIDNNGNVQYNNSHDIFRECPLVRVYIGEGVKKIPATLFNNCSSLARVQMASTVESIGKEAFAGCTSLEHIDLPSSLKEIANDALPTNNLKSVACYMKAPIDMGSSDEELLADATVYQSWTEAMKYGQEYYYGWWYPQTPIGTGVCYYRIDANRKVSWGYWYEDNFGEAVWSDEVPITEDAHLALLQVPKEQLSAYQSNPLWAAFIDKIETLDGASDVEPVSQTTIVNVSESVKEEADLSNTMMGNIYVTLDVEDSGDGYNAQEGCLIINSTTSEEGLAAAIVDDAEDLTVKNLYNGLILEVPEGKGKVVVDCQTLGQNVVFVKIGDTAPQATNTYSRQQLSVPYDVEENTHVYIYAAKASVEANSNVRRAAYANDDAVKIYAVKVDVDINNNPDGIKDVITNGALSYPLYTIDGKKINIMQKGVNIIRYSNGQIKKVIIK